MLKPSYIKEAREKKGLSIENVASKLKLNITVVKNIEEGVSLNGIYSSYEISYKKSIYKFLELEIPKSEKKMYSMNYNFQILMIIYFIIFFSFSIMTITHYLISNFCNNKVSKLFTDNYKKDELMILLESSTKNSELNHISSEYFIENLKFIKKFYTSNYLYIKSKPNTSSYYKIYFKEDDLEKFGKLDLNNDLVVDKNKEFLIDISDTSTIDFIIFNNSKYKLTNDFRYYLKNFDIKSLYLLK